MALTKGLGDHDPGEFLYEALDLSRPTIRVLRILPGKKRTSISCTLLHVPLKGSHTCLSYTWGDNDAMETILLNGKVLRVRRNLYDFLRHARQDKIMEDLWIDAICLDQSSTAERNHQVQQMWKIYARARRTIIWLGESFSSIRLSQRFLQYYTHLHTSKWLLKMVLSLLYSRHTTALKALATAPYWVRLWVMQELLLSRRCTVFLGRSAVEFDQLLGIVTAMDLRDWHLIPILDGNIYPMIPEDNEIAQEEADSFSFNKLLHAASTLKCAEERDRVYGLIGILPFTRSIKVDYNESKEAMFFRIAVNGCFDARSLFLGDRMKALGSALGLEWLPMCISCFRTQNLAFRRLFLPPHGGSKEDDEVEGQSKTIVMVRPPLSRFGQITWPAAPKDRWYHFLQCIKCKIRPEGKTAKVLATTQYAMCLGMYFSREFSYPESKKGSA